MGIEERIKLTPLEEFEVDYYRGKQLDASKDQLYYSQLFAASFSLALYSACYEIPVGNSLLFASEIATGLICISKYLLEGLEMKKYGSLVERYISVQ